jgi:hypothetical protein
MSERYKECRSWQPRHDLTTPANKQADACDDSKHKGTLFAVEHYVRQAAQRTKQQTLDQIELQALQALGELQVTRPWGAWPGASGRAAG